MNPRKLSLRVFLSILLVLVVPFTAMLWYVKAEMEGMLREQISAKVVENLKKSENGLNQTFSRMTNVSNVFYWDDALMDAFVDERASYYDRYVAFNKIIRNIAVQNLYEYRTDEQDDSNDYIRITFFDRSGHIYTSWSRNYGDYAYLLMQDWISTSLAAHGFLVWNMASLGYAPGGADAPHDQITLARTVLSSAAGAGTIGTLLISIDQSRLIDTLNTYKYDAQDIVFAATDGGEVLLRDEKDALNVGLPAIADRFSGRESGYDVLTLDGRRYLLTYYTVAKTRLANKDALKIFYLTGYEQLDAQIGALTSKISALCVFFALAVAVLALLIAAQIARPMRRLSAHMAAYRAGDEPVMLEVGRRDEIGEIYTAYYQMSAHIRDLFERLRQEQATKEKYYYESLRARMSPHFLFNTLNAIRWMAILRGADNITKSVDALVVILKYSLETGDEMVPLGREVEVVKSYCHIQGVRFGNGCALKIDMDSGMLELPIIRFILQPTVENCFKHGFKGGQAGNEIYLTGTADEQALTLVVEDNGCGFSPEALSAFARRRASSEAAGGIGLQLVDERIRIAFGEGWGLTLMNRRHGGARVLYRLPVIGKGEAN